MTSPAIEAPKALHLVIRIEEGSSSQAAADDAQRNMQPSGEARYRAVYALQRNAGEVCVSADEHPAARLPLAGLRGDSQQLPSRTADGEAGEVQLRPVFGQLVSLQEPLAYFLLEPSAASGTLAESHAEGHWRSGFLVDPKGLYALRLAEAAWSSEPSPAVFPRAFAGPRASCGQGCLCSKRGGRPRVYELTRCSAECPARLPPTG